MNQKHFDLANLSASTQQLQLYMYMLDYTLPQVAKLCKTLQPEHLDLLLIPSLVDSTLCALDGTVLPAASWVRQLLDEAENLEKTARIEISSEDITPFQKNIVKPFIVHLKDNISSRFASSSDVVSAMGIFDPKKMPSVESPDLHRPHWHTSLSLWDRQTWSNITW